MGPGKLLRVGLVCFILISCTLLGVALLKNSHLVSFVQNNIMSKSTVGLDITQRDSDDIKSNSQAIQILDTSNNTSTDINIRQAENAEGESPNLFIAVIGALVLVTSLFCCVLSLR